MHLFVLLFCFFFKDCTWYRQLTIKFDYFWHIVDYQFTGIIIASILSEAARLQLVCNCSSWCRNAFFLVAQKHLNLFQNVFIDYRMCNNFCQNFYTNHCLFGYCYTNLSGHMEKLLGYPCSFVHSTPIHFIHVDIFF